MSEGDTQLTLVCGHAFHRSCISDWLLRESVCVVCRADAQVPTPRASAGYMAHITKNASGGLRKDDLPCGVKRSSWSYKGYTVRELRMRNITMEASQAQKGLEPITEWEGLTLYMSVDRRNTTGYRGVSKRSDKKPRKLGTYCAKRQGKIIGYYDTALEAAVAYARKRLASGGP